MAIGQDFIGQDFYPGGSDRNAAQSFGDLSSLQAYESLLYGDKAAKYADPFMGERKQYQNQLSNLMANPGSFASSPTYQFAFNQGLEALNRRSAASGKTGSGNYLADLMKYGQGMASQQFFPQANLLAQLAQGGSSPAAAGLSYGRGAERSQDQQQMAAAGKAAGGSKQQIPQQVGTPWWMQPDPITGRNSTGSPVGGTGLPSGGAYGGYQDYYTPSANAGTGYMTSDYGQTNFGGGMDYQPFDAGGYGSFAGGGGDFSIPDYSGDFGGGDYIGGYEGGYGGEEW